MSAAPTGCPERHCFKVSDTRSFAARAHRAKTTVRELRRLVDAVDGQCMVCRGCHAQVLDLGRIGAQPRGVVCRCCRTRLSVADGAEGNLLGGSADFCYCQPGNQEWDDRAELAALEYLRRAADIAAVFTGPGQQFAELVRRVETDGVDVDGAWNVAAAQVRERLATERLTAARSGEFTEPDYTVSPLDRIRCLPLCTRHSTHLYASCFPTPTMLRSRDYHPDDRNDHPLSHYVGFTSQVPPFKRIREHGGLAANYLVLLVPGAEREERPLKLDGLCPQCGAPLWYFRIPKPDLGTTIGKTSY